MAAYIRNPVEWALDQLRLAGHTVEETGRFVHGTEATRYSAPPVVRRIGIADLREALAQGFSDFTECRTDVILLCLIYPLVGLVLSRLVFGYDMLPLIFPLASGFALLGPVAAVGLVAGSLPFFLGLAIVIPILGHATWHLYRKVVEPPC